MPVVRCNDSTQTSGRSPVWPDRLWWWREASHNLHSTSSVSTVPELSIFLVFPAHFLILFVYHPITFFFFLYTECPTLLLCNFPMLLQRRAICNEAAAFIFHLFCWEQCAGKLLLVHHFFFSLIMILISPSSTFKTQLRNFSFLWCLYSTQGLLC